MRNNKKGFTLVELLAVIVILALIMGIAVVSISGVLQSTRESTFRETALTIINGVRQRLVLANEQGAGCYSFDEGILESGGKQSPFGKEIVIGQASGATAVTGGMAGSTTKNNIYKNSTCESSCPTAGATKSYVKVAYDSNTNRYTYSICLYSGSKEKYVDGTEDQLNAGASTTIKTAAS